MRNEQIERDFDTLSVSLHHIPGGTIKILTSHIFSDKFCSNVEKLQTICVAIDVINVLCLFQLEKVVGETFL